LIVLQQGSLRVGSAVIPVQYLGAAFVISNQDAFAERGRNLNPRAFTRFQIGVNQLVKIEITDLEDPTPYWLISTRNPELLVSFLRKVS
jgi:hypothetical protein